MNSRRWILAALCGIFLGLIQATFLSLLPSPWREFQPVLATCVLLVVLNRSKHAILFSGVAGFVLHLFTVGGNSFAFIWLMVTTVIVTVISQSLLTNRSMYATAALTVFARIIFQSLAFIVLTISSFLFNTAYIIPSFRQLIVITAWDVALSCFGFLAVAMLTRRFQVTINRLNEYE
jgi:hypothetical protein